MNYIYLAKYDTVNQLLSKAGRYFIALQHSARCFFMLNNLGILSLKQANYPEAQRYFLQALPLFEQLGSAINQVNVRNNLAIIYEKQALYRIAWQYYEQALAVNLKNNNLAGIALNLDNHGSLYSSQKRYNKALTYFKKAEEQFTTLNDVFGAAKSQKNAGSALLKLYKEKEALAYFQKAHAANLETKNNSGLLLSNLGMAQGYMALKEPEKAREYARYALLIFLETAEQNEAPERYQVLHKVYASRAIIDRPTINSLLPPALAIACFLWRNKPAGVFARTGRKKVLQKADSLHMAQLTIQQDAAERNQLIWVWMSVFSLLLIGLVTLYIWKERVLRREFSQLGHQKNQIELNQSELHQQATRLKAANEEIRQMNDQLEALVHSRTLELENKNHQLEDYAYLNAHKLRAPLARLLGLLYMAKLTNNQVN